MIQAQEHSVILLNHCCVEDYNLFRVSNGLVLYLTIRCNRSKVHLESATGRKTCDRSHAEIGYFGGASGAEYARGTVELAGFSGASCRVGLFPAIAPLAIRSFRIIEQGCLCLDDIFALDDA